MKAFRSTCARDRLGFGVFAALAVASVAASASGCTTDGNSIVTRVGNSSVMITDGENSDAVEVNINNGDITVKLNGKEIPADRIIREGNSVIILDENGKAMRNVRILMGSADGGHGFLFGGAAAGGAGWNQWIEGGDAPAALHEALMAAAGPPPKVMLGVTLTEPGEALETHLKLEPGTTTMLGGLYDGLPAHAAGLGEFDIIVKVDGKTPADPGAIRKVLAEKEPGGTIVLSVIHAGAAPRDVTVKLEAYDTRKMKEAKFLGSAAGTDRIMRMFSSRQAPDGDGAEMPDAYWKALEGLKLGPDAQAYRLMAPRAEVERELAERLAQKSATTEKLQERLDELDKRMADLDAMIRKLLDEKSKSGGQ